MKEALVGVGVAFVGRRSLVAERSLVLGSSEMMIDLFYLGFDVLMVLMVG